MKVIFNQVLYVIIFKCFCVNAFAQDSIYDNDSTINEEYLQNDVIDNYFPAFFADTNDIKSFNSSKAKHFKTRSIVYSNYTLLPEKKVIQSYKNDENFIYTEDKEKQKQTISEYIGKLIERALKRIFGTNLWKLPNYIFQILKYFFLSVFITAIIYFILKMRYKNIFNKKNTLIDIDEIDKIDEIQQVNFTTPLYEAIQQKKYRIAMRLRYFETLQLLEKKQIIQWNKYKTNHDYLYEIKDETIRNNFKKIVQKYEWAWFGESDINELHYNQFDHWNKNLNTVQEQLSEYA